MLVWHCLPRVSLCGSVGQLFFLNIYYLNMDGNGKKKSKKSQIWRKKNWSSSKTGGSVGNAKQTIFYFWPGVHLRLYMIEQ